MKGLTEAATYLALIGATNVGLSAAKWNLIEKIPLISNYLGIVYGAIGASGLYLLLKKWNVIKGE